MLGWADRIHNEFADPLRMAMSVKQKTMSW